MYAAFRTAYGWSRRYSRVIRLVMSVIGIAVVIQIVREQGFIEKIDVFTPAFWSAQVLGQTAILLAVFRMRYSLAAIDVLVSWPAAWKIHLQSFVYLVVVPVFIAQDVVKLAKLTNLAGAPMMRVTGGLVIDRIAGLVSTLIVALAFLWLSPFYGTFVPPEAILGLGGIVFVAVLIWLGRGVRLAPMRLRVWVANFVVRRRCLTISLLIGIGNVLFLASAVWVASFAVLDGVDYTLVVFVVASAIILQTIPITVLGLGLPELGAVALYNLAGLELSVATSLVLTQYSFKLCAGLIGAGLEVHESLRRKPQEATDQN